MKKITGWLEGAAVITCSGSSKWGKKNGDWTETQQRSMEMSIQG